MAKVNLISKKLIPFWRKSRRKSLCAFLFLALVSPNANCVAHELEDGHVNRKVQLTLRDDILFVRFAIGCNDQTLAQLYTNESGESAPKDLPTLQSKFEAIAGKMASSGLVVKLGEKQVEPVKLSSSQSGNHHERFVVELQIQLELGTDSQTLTMQDENFLKYSGAARYAFRTRGKTILLSSDVAPLIARAKPIDLSALSEEKRKEICQINARVKLIGR